MNERKKDQDPANSFLSTDRGKTKSNAIEIPAINLPKGGGAIKGIDEKFTVNAVNGTASFSIPLPFSAARGASPTLNLSYNSGGGNGIFGLGWGLNLAAIKRKTDNGLPRYLDGEDTDTFLFSEAEDLVPEYRKEGNGSFSVDGEGNYIIKENVSKDGLFIIRFYKPRIEGLFACVERWVSKGTAEIKWRIITKENVTTLFGWSDASRIADPNDARKIYQWLPEFVFDDHGNCSQYVYKKEDEKGFDITLLHHKNRIKEGRLQYANLYLEKVLYGNKTPYKEFGAPFLDESAYVFATVFDYGEYEQLAPFAKVKDWDFRIDAFSDYKAGFEIRTTRLCKRVFLVHHFKEEGYEGWVKSTNFEYDTASQLDFTFLKAITDYGYIKTSDQSYSQKQLPAIEFDYQKHDWNKEVKSVSQDNLVHAPAGLDEQHYQFTDLYNEGLSGILTEQAEGWYYKQNLGDGHFAHAKLITPKPSFSGLGGMLQLADLDSDGSKQLVNYDNEPMGFFELDENQDWLAFQSFKELPNVNFNDPFLKMLDLNGDGKPEMLIAEDHLFTWYNSEGRKGFSAAQKSSKSAGEEEGPHIIFSDKKQTIFLADMSGSGMTDIVRIRNGEVCYWPNLGYGRFGAKIGMDNAPVFDSPDTFHASYLRLADIDGSGTTDLIYLGKNKFTCWMNLNGNSFCRSPFEIDSFPAINNLSKVIVADLLGNGVACIVWSGKTSEDNNTSVKYVDLMNSKKPYLMISYKNNLGKKVSLEYSPSTKFYLEDKKAGRPWITKLHFPVHCIAQTITADQVSGCRFVSSYIYHHGYYDHAEREFRGFGMVEQIDTEDFDHWVKGEAANIVIRELHQEPVVTKNWYHTGAYIKGEKILSHFADEYWFKEMERQGFQVAHFEENLPDVRLIMAAGLEDVSIDQLTAQEWQEAIRACKGMSLRSESFARDAEKEKLTNEDQKQAARKTELTPYAVATHNCVIELLQPKGKNKHAVFVVKESEAITYNYERIAEDPRVAHTLNIKLDEYGNVLECASVVYPRRVIDSSLPLETRQEQSRTVIIYTQNRYTNDVINDSEVSLPYETKNYRLRLPCESKTFELNEIAKVASFYSIADFDDVLTHAKEVAYHDLKTAAVPGQAQQRLIEHTRTNYYDNNLKDPLPLGYLHFLAIPYQSYQLAYTPELLSDIYVANVMDDLLIAGRFTHSENDFNWWVSSGTTLFLSDGENILDVQDRFFAPIAFIDPYYAITKVKYGPHYLFIKETEDNVGNTTAVVQFNYRTLSPEKMKDINRNLSQVITDELGLVKATAVCGKGNEADDLFGLNESSDTEEITLIHNFFNVPATTEGICESQTLINLGKQLLQHASVRFIYDFESFKNYGKPVVVASIAREVHFQKNIDSPVQLSFEYSNGLGQIVMKKLQAEPGIAKKVVVDGQGARTIAEIDTSAKSPELWRWIGNGRSILNNKGNIVKQYEPYFSVNPWYEDDKDLVETGVTTTMYYDAVGRMIKTEMPDSTYSKVEFNSWKQVVFDANDTVLQSSWYTNRTNRLIDVELLAEGKDPGKEKIAADNAAKHANTPNILHFDTLGRPILSIDHYINSSNGTEEFYPTKINLDAESNLRNVTDARNNVVMQYKYDMLGNLVYQNSMDAGKRWLLHNILGKPLRSWDERDHEFQYFYDAANRPTYSKVIGGDGLTALDHIYDRVIYGEDLLTGIRTANNRFNEVELQNRNILGKVIQHYDTGGLVETPVYDFKGQPLATTRKLFKKYKEVANWTDDNLYNDLEPGDGFKFSTTTDALGRITEQITPDNSSIMPAYNNTGLLTAEKVLHPAEAEPSIYIKDIDYNEKGQRNKIIYGNNVITRFYYDKETFRLQRLESKRQNGSPLQDWHYTYDPVGNITHIEDKNIPVAFFDNQKITGVSTFIYDSLYRLTAATGRENDAALKYGDCDNWNDKPFMQDLSPGDPMASRNYTQSYDYDAVGNILKMKHLDGKANWTREYEYETANNRLKRTFIGDNANPASYTKYRYHAKHGYLEELPHLEHISWNFKEEVILTSRQHCTTDKIPVITYYQYDGSGQRIRKITENQASAGNVPTKKEERIYVSGFELYKKHSNSNAGLERTSLSLMDEGHRFIMIETRNNVDDGTEKKLVRYQLHNHLGSAALELDGSPGAMVISYEEYHPFGTTAFQAARRDVITAAKRYRYIGMERDEETGFSYHSARYYLSWLGRWLSSDPIGLGGGINFYRYANNNPIVSVDINGKSDSSVVNSGDAANPRNYASFEAYQANQPMMISPVMLKEKWDNAHAPQLMSRWPYSKSVPDREELGHSVQREHPIQISLRAEQRGRTGAEQRKISSSRDELTILVESGKGYFHTELSKLQADIRRRAQAGKITSESQLIEETRDAYKTAGQIAGVEINEFELDYVFLSNLGVQSETYEQTRNELSEHSGPTTITNESIDAAFNDNTQEASIGTLLVLVVVGGIAISGMELAALATEVLAETGTVSEINTGARIAEGLETGVGTGLRIAERIEESTIIEEEFLEPAEELIIEESLKRMRIQ